MMLVDVPYFIKLIKRVWYKKRILGIGPNRKDILMTQAEANSLFEGPKMELETLFSDIGNLILTSIFFHPLFPVSIPMCAIGLVL
jgi:hypothetical protein